MCSKDFDNDPIALLASQILYLVSSLGRINFPFGHDFQFRKLEKTPLFDILLEVSCELVEQTLDIHSATASWTVEKSYNLAMYQYIN